MKKFNNQDLQFEIEKIQNFDTPITVSKEFDSNLGFPFALDIEDNSYFYLYKRQRDEDFNTLKQMMPKFSFVHL